MGSPHALEVLVGEWQEGLRPNWNPSNHPYSRMLSGERPEALAREIYDQFVELHGHDRYSEIRDEVATLVVECIEAANPAAKQAFEERAKRRLDGLKTELFGASKQ